ncbi:MAG: hypothetical protein HYT79_02730 [Elusimicrobia bacterium]|nr:hypothetical protein [Elusimicrobiota bacterium]
MKFPQARFSILAAMTVLVSLGVAALAQEHEGHHNHHDMAPAPSTPTPPVEDQGGHDRHAPPTTPVHPPNSPGRNHGDHNQPPPTTPDDESLAKEFELELPTWRGLMRLGFTAQAWRTKSQEDKQTQLNDFARKRGQAAQKAQHLLISDSQANCDEIRFLRTYLGDDLIKPILIRHEESQAHLAHQHPAKPPSPPQEGSQRPMERLIKDIALCRIYWDSPGKPTGPTPPPVKVPHDHEGSGGHNSHSPGASPGHEVSHRGDGPGAGHHEGHGGRVGHAEESHPSDGHDDSSGGVHSGTGGASHAHAASSKGSSHHAKEEKHRKSHASGDPLMHAVHQPSGGAADQDNHEMINQSGHSTHHKARHEDSERHASRSMQTHQKNHMSHEENGDALSHANHEHATAIHSEAHKPMATAHHHPPGEVGFDNAAFNAPGRHNHGVSGGSLTESTHDAHTPEIHHHDHSAHQAEAKPHASRENPGSNADFDSAENSDNHSQQSLAESDASGPVKSSLASKTDDKTTDWPWRPVGLVLASAGCAVWLWKRLSSKPQASRLAIKDPVINRGFKEETNHAPANKNKNVVQRDAVGSGSGISGAR